MAVQKVLAAHRIAHEHDSPCAFAPWRLCVEMLPCVAARLVFDHTDHKERKEAADLHLTCRFFVFTV